MQEFMHAEKARCFCLVKGNSLQRVRLYWKSQAEMEELQNRNAHEAPATKNVLDQSVIEVNGTLYRPMKEF